jgi:hypothetical protein
VIFRVILVAARDERGDCGGDGEREEMTHEEPPSNSLR